MIVSVYRFVRQTEDLFALSGVARHVYHFTFSPRMKTKSIVVLKTVSLESYLLTINSLMLCYSTGYLFEIQCVCNINEVCVIAIITFSNRVFIKYDLYCE